MIHLQCSASSTLVQDRDRSWRCWRRWESWWRDPITLKHPHQVDCSQLFLRRWVVIWSSDCRPLLWYDHGSWWWFQSCRWSWWQWDRWWWWTTPFATNWLQGNTFPIPSFFKPFVVDERSIYLNLFIFSFGKSDLSDTHYSTVNRRPCIYFLHLWFLESLN